MEWLNYHHLLYFWTVVREGGLVPAAQALRLSHPTVSGQIKQLEAALDQRLFDRSGRRLELTEVGRVVYGYADDIFNLGRELLDTIKHRPTGRPLRLAVGISDVIPKLIVAELLRPALERGPALRLVVYEDRHERLLAELALHRLDVVLADAPVPPDTGIRAHSHRLGECGISFFATPQLARSLRERFPESLDGAPLIVPGASSMLRRALEQWLSTMGVTPQIAAEVEDSALIKVLGQRGLGVFAVPRVIASEVARQHRVQRVGDTEAVKERFYAITVERKLKHPAVAAISSAAQRDLFAAAD